MDAYLDIETTGLSSYSNDITVIGIGIAQGSRLRIVQLFNDTLTRGDLTNVLGGVSRPYTYNGGQSTSPSFTRRWGSTWQTR